MSDRGTGFLPPPPPYHGALVEDAGGEKLCALGKQTPEPVFRIIKFVLGFRQFLLHGLAQVRGKWSLVTMAWNLKRTFVLSYPGRTVGVSWFKYW